MHELIVNEIYKILEDIWYIHTIFKTSLVDDLIQIMFNDNSNFTIREKQDELYIIQVVNCKYPKLIRVFTKLLIVSEAGNYGQLLHTYFLLNPENFAVQIIHPKLKQLHHKIRITI